MPSTPSMPPTPPPATHANPAKALLMIGALIVVLGALWFMSSIGLFGPLGSDVAEKGEAVRNFPQSLIPSGDPFIESSYSITYKDAGREFPVVNFTSTKGYEATIDEFRRMLVADGWLILRDGSASDTPLTSFYATKGDAEVNITVEDKQAGPWVTIAYSKPQ